MAEAVKAGISNLLETLHITSPSEQGVPPTEPSGKDLKSLQEKYEKAGQDQVFAFYDQLSVAEKASLYEQLQNFDPDRINHLAEVALHPPKKSDDEEKPSIEPLPDSATASILDSKKDDIEKWYNGGLEHIANNKVAVLLMAGGQGTRLGSSAPKGCFDIGLPSHKSLFQVQAERIWKIQRLAAKHFERENVVVPWYVMTSGPTRKPTEKFFEEHNYFGLQKENVYVFEQGVLPCISNDGKILMESKSKVRDSQLRYTRRLIYFQVAVAPDGNGGIYHALLTSNARIDMRKRGIEHVHAYCVDNCLVKVADPTFIGFAASKDVDIATKVVRKRNAKEPVGLIIQKSGKPDVIEYSEIDKDLAEEKDFKNQDVLKFRAANIVNHYYSFRFLETMENWSHKLPHHVARKKIPFVDTETGENIKPGKPNGVKLEQFVFDVFPFVKLEQFASLEVDRKDEFSPLKNGKGTGEDDPDTSRKDILDQGTRWVKAAGATVVSETDSSEEVEVSPLISYVCIAQSCTISSTDKTPGWRRAGLSEGPSAQVYCGD
jgi:UDP-N-acetylglucosamine/UDP-N-acetylgalactosamine diphosphorylase